jgi:hypothetical protein
MIWADRVGIVWMVAVVIIFLANAPPHSADSTLGWVIFAPWLLMRALDWIFSGEFRHHFGWPR